jgi:hypothetical protein
MNFLEISNCHMFIEYVVPWSFYTQLHFNFRNETGLEYKCDEWNTHEINVVTTGQVHQVPFILFPNDSRPPRQASVSHVTDSAY